MAPLSKHSTLPRTAHPVHGDHFDAWNSASSGHQRAECRPVGTIPWRQTRVMKMESQFKSGGQGGKRLFDGVDRGSANVAPSLKGKGGVEVGARPLKRQRVSVAEMLVGKKNVTAGRVVEKRPSDGQLPITRDSKAVNERSDEETASTGGKRRGIFDGLVIYVNGSTYPLISDHKLKQLLAENGASLAIHLGRRQVTHVILGRPNGSKIDGAGGGLAGGKIEKEIRRVGGCGVKYVGVEWILESIRAGKRLQEAQFSNLKTAPKGQQSVYSIFKKADSSTSMGSSGTL
ncbi:hypothetical protein F5884DRAFT_74433 [Xylogone sp. PMI_703]|nr:hypothetical protein F5884DRAFT_74433 [Xylogone sp. PMI_703]